MKAQSIGGAWVRSGKARADIDPCDTRDVVGEYAREEVFSPVERVIRART